MTTQELQQIIEDLNQLANNIEGKCLSNRRILDAIHNDEFKTYMLGILACNNVPYTLCSISSEITGLAHRIYELKDYEDSEKQYLHKTLHALDGFKAEIQRIQEYVSLLKQIGSLDNDRAKYRANILGEGNIYYKYKCSIDNIDY